MRNSDDYDGIAQEYILKMWYEQSRMGQAVHLRH